MKINFSYSGADETCKTRLENYVTEEKLGSLTRLLQHGNFEVADLGIRTEYRPHHNNFSIRIDLKIPRHILDSEETSYNLTEAFDLALDKIVTQMRKIEEIRHHK